jgi:predicted amidohydrolase YtcJ
MLEASREGMKVAASRGVVAIHDKDGWLGAFEVFERLLEDDELLARVWQSLPWERLDELAALGIRSGFGNDMLRLGYLKGFMDGTLGSATALLLDGSGVEITSSATLAELVRRAARAGWPVAVHAIGDGANRSALDAFEATRDEWLPRGLRPRIEHAQLLAPEELERFAAIGVSASVQFSHAPSDRDLADRLWEGRQGAYAYRSLADAGARLANGSDAPVEELDPLAGIVAGVRRTLDERPPWRPEQAVTLDEALRATCIAPAWLEHEEQRRGMLRPGMLADLVVLDRDPFECEPGQLGELRVVATMVGGRWTHGAADWQPE